MARLRRRDFVIRLAVCGLLCLLGLGTAPQDDSERAKAHLWLAEDYSGRNEWQEAARHWEASLPWLRTAGERRLLVQILQVLGKTEFDLGRYRQAAERFEEAAALCEKDTTLGDPDLIRGNLANIYLTMGRRADALPLLQEALRRAEASGRPEKAAHILVGLAILSSDSGDLETALRQFRRAEDLFQGKPGAVAGIRQAMAASLADHGRYDEALALLKQVEELCRKTGLDGLRAEALNVQMVLHQALGRYEEAQQLGDEALRILRRIGPDADRAVVLSNLATLDYFRGKYDRALSRLDDALELTRESGDRRGEAVVLILSGHLLRDLGRSEEALARYELGLEMARALGAHDVQASALHELGGSLAVEGRLAEALAYEDEALALVRNAGLRSLEIQILVARGLTLSSMNQFERARDDARKALDLGRELGDRSREAEAHHLIGLTFLLQKRLQEARGSFELAVATHRELGSWSLRSVALAGLGGVYELLGQPEAAIAAYREAAEVAEANFAELKADDLLAGLAGHTIDPLTRWASLLASRDDPAQAFAVAERARAQAFLRRIGNLPPDLRRGADPALLVEEERLRARLQALTRQLREEQRKTLSAQDRGVLATVAREIDKTRRSYESLLIRLEQASPESASLVRPSHLTLPEVQKLLAAGTTLVEYFWVEEGALVWVIDRDSMHLARLPIHREEAARRIELFRQRIAARVPIEQDASDLYKALFAPVASHIRHRQVLLVPHGPLHALPFAALSPDGGETFLMERFAMTLLPSASVLPFLQAKRSADGGRMLALGNPDGSLPHAAAEARAVSHLYGGEPLLGSAATESALRQVPPPVDYLHLAAHAVFDPARPLFSRVELAAGGGEDGALEVHEIFRLNLRGTNLVVLSGCNTGLGTPTEGDELESLSRAFLYAGTPAVVTTLWPVDDAASAELMKSFYRRLRSGTGPAEALRAAQAEVLDRVRNLHPPYFWAGFTLTGDAGVPESVSRLPVARGRLLREHSNW